jgi:hypothetical protein
MAFSNPNFALLVPAVTIKTARQRIGCQTGVLQAVRFVLAYILGNEVTKDMKEPVRVAQPDLPSSSNTKREVVEICAEDDPAKARQKIRTSFIERVEDYLDAGAVRWRPE